MASPVSSPSRLRQHPEALARLCQLLGAPRLGQCCSLGLGTSAFPALRGGRETNQTYPSQEAGSLLFLEEWGCGRGSGAPASCPVSSRLHPSLELLLLPPQIRTGKPGGDRAGWPLRCHTCAHTDTAHTDTQIYPTVRGLETELAPCMVPMSTCGLWRDGRAHHDCHTRRARGHGDIPAHLLACPGNLSFLQSQEF